MAKKINVQLFLEKIQGISLKQAEELLIGVQEAVKEKRQVKVKELQSQIEQFQVTPMEQWAEKNGFVKQDQTA